MMFYIAHPGTRWLLSGIIILCFPLIWRARMRGSVHSLLRIELSAMVWSFRALGLIFGVGSIVLALVKRGMMIEAQFMLGSATVAIFLAVPLARMILGAPTMSVSDQERRRYWQITRALGMGYLAMSLLTFLLLKRPQ